MTGSENLPNYLPTVHLVVRSSKIHAKGCYTTIPLKQGTFIVEYTGERLTVDEADERYEDRADTYLFGLSDGEHVIDGDNIAAFVNHSCDPNCETEEIDGRVWITAMRDIEAGEELTYDYYLYDGEDESPCSCGATNCRGTLYSEEAIAKREKDGEEASPAAIRTGGGRNA